MTLLRLTIASGLLTLLCACGSTPDKVEVPKPEQTTTNIPVEVAPQTPEQIMQEARNAQHAQEKNTLLLSAAELWQQTDCNKSLRVVETIRPYLVTQDDLSQATLIEAECLFEHGLAEQASDLLVQDNISLTWHVRLLSLQARMAESQSRWLQAASLWQQVSQLDESAQQYIWPLLKRLSVKELEQATLRKSNLRAWLQLALITRHYSNDAMLMATELQRWQLRNPNHPAIQNLPADLDLALHTYGYTPRDIAILLPLSGRLSAQGEAIKQGIVAAYFEQPQHQRLHFFDTAELDANNLAQQTQDMDFIIGPLLKENIEAFEPLVSDKPMLALNRVDSSQAEEHFFYALAPEDEGEQLADTLFARGFRHPVMVSSTHPALTRMADSFQQRWHVLAESQPPRATFSSNEQMQVGMESLLEVDQSNVRIKSIEDIYPGQLYSYHRNRQDIDAIVLFANAQETELLVPIVESSISPFSALIPIYGSSRSFSHDLKANSMRDLDSLHFIDMPWMLPEHPWSSITEQSQQLWPNRRDSLKRLFAMGYDSMQLIPHLKHMAILPELKLLGLTGALGLDQQNLIHRQLSWGKVENEQVTRIAMD